MILRTSRKQTRTEAAIVDGDQDALVLHKRPRDIWLIGKVKNHALGYEAPESPIQFVTWQFLGKPHFEQYAKETPRYVAGIVLYAAMQNGNRRAFEEPFMIRGGEIEFERNACPMRYREEIEKEAIRLAGMTEITVFRQTLLPRERRSRNNEKETTKILVPTEFVKTWFEKNYPGGWKAWWYRYTPEHTRTLADDMKAAGIEIEEV